MQTVCFVFPVCFVCKNETCSQWTKIQHGFLRVNWGINFMLPPGWLFSLFLYSNPERSAHINTDLHMDLYILIILVERAKPHGFILRQSSYHHEWVLTTYWVLLVLLWPRLTHLYVLSLASNGDIANSSACFVESIYIYIYIYIHTLTWVVECRTL